MSTEIQRLCDFIIIDAVSWPFENLHIVACSELPPAAALAKALTSSKMDEEFGQFCLVHTYANFREHTKQGYNIVVTVNALGCGSFSGERSQCFVWDQIHSYNYRVFCLRLRRKSSQSQIIRH
jgi:hypothetical protein